MDFQAKRLNQTLRLADGRQLGYAEMGDPEGIPVIYCHGFPASRLESVLIASAALNCNARIIAPDRPGYGLSDWKAKRRLHEWSDDVLELTESLGLDQFRVLAVSGGAPYGLVLAAKLNHQIRNLSLVGGLGPVYRQSVRSLMQWPGRLGFTWAQKSPALLQLCYGLLLGSTMRVRPAAGLFLLTLAMPPSDRRTLSRQDIHTTLEASVSEALRQGTRGAIQDMRLYAENWEIPLETITTPVALWHGTADTTVPVSHTRILAKALPHSEVIFLPDEGHFSLPVDYAEKILTRLVNDK